MSQLPPALAPLFHRYAWQTLDTSRHAAVIIPTVLQWGDWEADLWLFETYEWDTIRDWLAHDLQTSRTLPDAAQTFWTTAFWGKPFLPPSESSQRWAANRRHVPPDSVPAWLRNFR